MKKASNSRIDFLSTFTGTIATARFWHKLTAEGLHIYLKLPVRLHLNLYLKVSDHM